MAFRYLVAMGLNDFLAQISSNQYWTKTKHVKNTHDLNKLILEVVLIIQPFPRRWIVQYMQKNVMLGVMLIYNRYRNLVHACMNVHTERICMFVHVNIKVIDIVWGYVPISY